MGYFRAGRGRVARDHTSNACSFNFDVGECADCSGYCFGSHGWSDRYRFPAIYSEPWRVRADHDRVHLGRRHLRGKDKKAKLYLHFYEDEHPISAQLFGSDPNVMAEAARIVEGLGFDLVDLNLGCPAKKVVKCNGGSGC